MNEDSTSKREGGVFGSSSTKIGKDMSLPVFDPGDLSQ
jgi:hypothetical protein